MYPFTRQLLEYNSNNLDKKLGILILDAKGNYYNQVKKYAKQFNLLNDLIVIELNSNVFYNPLHKPNLKPQILANRFKTIFLFLLFQKLICFLFYYREKKILFQRNLNRHLVHRFGIWKI